MNLKKAILLTIIASLYFFLLRTIWTFAPGLFRSRPLIMVIFLCSFLMSLAVILFYTYFLKEFVTEDEQNLKIATNGALIGACLMSILYLARLTHFMAAPKILAIEPYLVLISLIFTFVFFIAFYSRIKEVGPLQLKIPVLMGLLGVILMLILHLLIVYQIFTYGVIEWFGDKQIWFTRIFMPFPAISFILGLYFYISFYRYLTTSGISSTK